MREYPAIELKLPTRNGRYIPLFTGVVETDISLLFGLDFLHKDRLLLNYQTNGLESSDYNWQLPLTYKFGNMFME